MLLADKESVHVGGDEIPAKIGITRIVRPPVGPRRRGRSLLVTPRLVERQVVRLPQFQVGQHAVRLGDLGEAALVFFRRILDLVRVVLFRQPAVGLADFQISRLRFDFKNLVMRFGGGDHKEWASG